MFQKRCCQPVVSFIVILQVVYEGADLPRILHQAPTLVNVSLEIAPGEKVAICGPSGSGKSFLIMALLRMVELSEGQIMIDGTDVSMLNGEKLRSCLNIIPQEPIFVPGTVRFNLDPHKRSNDESIQMALRTVGLWGRLVAGEGSSSDIQGLDTALVASDWSQGERQLLCLARAMLVPSRLVILDEATSRYEPCIPLPHIRKRLIYHWKR